MSLPVSELLVIVLLTLLEAVFVAAEIALVSVRRSRVEQLVEDGVQGAARVRRMLDEPGRFLAVVQIGVTFVGFLASAFAAVSLTGRLRGLFETVPALASSAEPIALIIVTLLLALFTIVFGELVPKSLALAHRERFAIALAGPVDILGQVLRPIVALLTGTTRIITRWFGVETQREASISTEELMLIVERGGEQGVLEAEEEQMIHAVIELGDRRVHEVMVPRIAIVALPVETAIDDAIDTIVGEGHSRIPVYEETVDEIVGILYAKDLLPFLKNGAEPRPNLRTLLRTPVFVPESMTIDDLLHELQRRKVHIAIILDEYGGTAGLVTIEDLLEEIVGEIQDEYDVEEPLVERLSDDEARIDGRASIDDLAETFDLELELEDEDEYDTVGGLIFHRIGGVPNPGDHIQVNGLVLTVESTDGRRVGKVLATRERADEEGQPAEAETDR
ncbi:MAG TPA: hemolysin family protein [Candidatus Limnocylindrales bacterium]|nr:hemolysin family protein [Candidatus Limnocylindrales bacterium]